MTIQTYRKIKTHVQVVRFEGGRESAMEICRWVGAGSAYIPSTNKDPQEYVQVPSMFGPRDAKVLDYITKIEDDTFLIYRPEALETEYEKVTDEDRRLVKHARAELSRFPNEDPEFVESIINAIKAFASYPGHSGNSAAIAIHMITALLNGHNLLPLTDDRDEWELHPGVKYGTDQDLWQSKRNSKAMSENGGKTYYLVDEPVNEDGTHIYHTSEPKDFEPEIDPEDLKSDDEKKEVNESNLS